MAFLITTTAQRPDLAETVAAWRVHTFFHAGGITIAQMTDLILNPRAEPNATFVLLDGHRPIATAGLMQSDLETRPDLTPWLGGVYVEPSARGRGHAITLIRCVEDHACAAGIRTLWLYTLAAEGLYRKCGWHPVGTEQENGRDVCLMRRDLDRAS